MKPARVVTGIIFAVALGAGIFVATRRTEPAPPAPAPSAAVAKPPPMPSPAELAAAAAITAANNSGIDMTAGFVEEGDYQLVRAQCTVCHSSKVVLQNRATREGWEKMIRWMQATQKLWDLGETEPKILDYLAKHYGPVEKGRRAPVKVDTWYELEPTAPDQPKS